MTYLAFTAMKWYTTMVHMARAPRVLAREYRVSWVIMVDCGTESRREQETFILNRCPIVITDL